MRPALFFRLLAVLAVWVVAIPAPALAVDIERVISPGGIEAWLVRDPKVPVISFAFSFEGAGAVAPAGKEGLPTLAAATMDEGAGDLDSQAYRTKLEDLAIRLNFDAGRESFSGRFSTLRDNRDEAYALVRLALTAPRFDQEAIDRIRTEMVDDLRRRAGDPNTIARNAAFATAFPGHAYAKDPRGTEAGLTAVVADDLRAFVKQQLGKDRLLVAAAGAISPEELGVAVDRLFGDLPANSTVPAVADTAPQGAGKTLTVDLPTAQTIAMLVGPGIDRQDPDWYAGQLAIRIVGGGDFSSRLMEEVRVKRGLTYGIYAANAGLDHAPIFYVSGSTVNAKAGAMLKVTRETLSAAADQGITAEELAEAKTYLTGSLPLQFDSTRSTAGIVLQIRRDHLPIDILKTRDAAIDAVTLDDANRVAKRLFDPAKMLTVLVGKPEGVEGQ